MARGTPTKRVGRSFFAKASFFALRATEDTKEDEPQLLAFHIPRTAYVFQCLRRCRPEIWDPAQRLPTSAGLRRRLEDEPPCLSGWD